MDSPINPATPIRRMRDLTDTKFADYVGLPGGPEKAATAAAIARNDPNFARGSFQRMLKAMTDALRGHAFGPLARDAISLTPSTTVRGQYAEVAANFAAFLTDHPGVTLEVRQPTAFWRRHDLTIKVAPLWLLRYPDGRREAMRPWTRAEAPAPNTVRAHLGLMTSVMDELCPGATPAILDLRRTAVPHRRLTLAQADVETWLDAEAAAFMAVARRILAA